MTFTITNNDVYLKEYNGLEKDEEFNFELTSEEDEKIKITDKEIAESLLAKLRENSFMFNDFSISEEI